MVLSHTPFKSLVPQFGSKPVMVSGVGSVPDVAQHYGFKNVITPCDVARAFPSAVPFWKDGAGKPLLSLLESLDVHSLEHGGKGFMTLAYIEQVQDSSSLNASISYVLAGQQKAAPGECPVRNLGYGSSKRPIESILVFRDPADWYLELQIMTDVIMGGMLLVAALNAEGGTRRQSFRQRQST